MPDNRKPLMYGAFPVCRNYTVRAHLRHPRPYQRSGCQDAVRHPGSHQCVLHAGHLHPCHIGYAEAGLRHRGRIHGGHLRKGVETVARKRKAGDGTVRQRKDGRWEGRIVIGYNDNGYPKTKMSLPKRRRSASRSSRSSRRSAAG